MLSRKAERFFFTARFGFGLRSSHACCGGDGLRHFSLAAAAGSAAAGSASLSVTPATSSRRKSSTKFTEDEFRAVGRSPLDSKTKPGYLAAGPIGRPVGGTHWQRLTPSPDSLES